MSEKIYVGSGKLNQGDTYSFVSITVDLEALYAASKAGHGFEAKTSGKKFIKLNLNTRKSPSEYGDTHTLTVDQWKPDPNKAKPVENPQTPKNTGFEDDIPF